MNSSPLAKGNTETYEGWNVGAISVKRVRISTEGAVLAETHRHGGEPERTAREMLATGMELTTRGVIVTGPQASSIYSLPYLPESACVEAALRHLQLAPDLVLSLGGETFLVYCIAGGAVRNMLSSSRCAAGSGEFLVQQFGRMDLDLDAGIRAARDGRRVRMASRCSVHCKSDATHKLNKGECTPADIAFSLIADLAERIAGLVKSANWPSGRILLAGGLTLNPLLVEELSNLIADARIDLLPESPFLEAFGAAVAAADTGPRPLAPQEQWIRKSGAALFETRLTLSQFTSQVHRMTGDAFLKPLPGMALILSVDAGSTTTKAVLLDRASRRPVAGCYLRTHGNPVRATCSCIAELRGQLAGLGDSDEFRIIQAAVTGSGRDLVSVYLGNCLSFNEILAHARAAREVAPEIDTLFELGGQDAKFVALQSGIPVDYSMNDGCSAGTGSFLEEAAAHDMQVPIDQIGPLALGGRRPVAFGERCAAFINSELRGALQQGAARSDVLAGLVYAITDNYLSRVVGARHIGRKILLQGGVALNPALAPAMAARVGAEVHVAPHPELMGCDGAARMALDLMERGLVGERAYDFTSFERVRMETKGTFTCKSCENRCEVQRIALEGNMYPFGGLCSKWEMQRRPEALRYKEGKDLVSLRHDLMFKDFAPDPPAEVRGRIGLPLALTTYQLFPFYARFLTELGYEVVLSCPGMGNRQTYAVMCYPGEIAHAAVGDLFAREVDFVFLPYLRELEIPEAHVHSFLCPVVQDIPGVIKAAFADHADKILSPEIGLSSHLRNVTIGEIARMADRLGVEGKRARGAFDAALEHQRRFEQAYREAVDAELKELKGPAVVLVGRPYAAFAPEVNLSVPRKIASRGFTVIPGDGLALSPPANEHDVWHFTQRTFAAVEYAKRREGMYVCALSCFSCGPDAITHHRFRHELEGSPFCFLEIDSHTAHAGIETRIGAFLDIIEERRRQPDAAGKAHRPHWTPARTEQGNGNIEVIDSSGRRFSLRDERVRHVLLADLPWITSQITAGLFGTMGWRTLVAPDTSSEILQKARTVCSGRECLPFLAMMGKIVAHLESRPEGELTLFHLLEHDGPCQIGNWCDAFSMMLQHLGQRDAVSVWPMLNNNYLGGGDKVALLIVAACIAGDLLGEVRTSLRCLAVDPAAAEAVLDGLERELLAAANRGVAAMDKELRRIARKLAAIPLRLRPGDVPRVLLFGGINRIFVDKPIRRFFEEQGILAKTNDISEFISYFEFTWILRPSFQKGRSRPEEHYSWLAILSDLARGPARAASLLAAKARVHCRTIEWLEKRWRRIMSRSGLLFSPHIPFRRMLDEAHRRVSWNGWTEAPCTLGRYFSSVRARAFDGYVNIESFGCAPANTATAVIAASGSRGGIPYAAIEADGTAITPSQIRQLETLAVQARERISRGVR